MASMRVISALTVVCCVLAAATFNGGFTYKFSPNLQYDIRAGVGLNDHSDDYFVGTGLSVRY